MFGNIIMNTPFTDDIANTACDHIDGGVFSNDTSFLATARALLLPRIPEGETLTIDIGRKSFRKSQIENANVDIAIDALLPMKEHNRLSIMELGRNAEDSDFCIDFVIEHISEQRNVRRIEKVTQFYEKVFKCACFVDEEIKQTYLFTEQLNMRTWHYLQCGILAYLPWYFKKEDGISKEEMDLIESLRSNKPDKYTECLAVIAKSHDFRSEYTRKALIGLETRIERSELERIRSLIERMDNEVREYEEYIADKMRNIQEQNIRLMGLEYKIRKDEEEGIDSEIMKYFLRNKRLYLRSYNDFSFMFDAKDYLMFWDEDLARNTIDNIRSFAYNPGTRVDVPYSQEEMKKLLEEIFIERNFKIIFCGTYNFDLQNRSVRAQSHLGYGYEFNDSTPNPHLDQYRCLGDYEKAINAFLRNNDYIGAIEQCVASVRSLNFGDGAVMQEFFRRWYGIADYGYPINMRCIELPDGEVVDPEGAINYLRKQNAENAQESEENNGENN